jgi:hypothetical protein
VEKFNEHNFADIRLKVKNRAFENQIQAFESQLPTILKMIKSNLYDQKCIKINI